MTAGFDASEVATLTALADLLVPAAEGMPSASQAGMPGPLLPLILNSRPELRVPLRQLLQEASGKEPMEYITSLYRDDPVGLRTLGLVVAGGYYLSADVKHRLGYPGQVRQINDADTIAEYFVDGALQRVIDRGPVWRDPDAQ